MPRPPRPTRRTTIRVDVSADAGRPIGPDVFGAFFEDINYAADGGLYAELVQNRSFAYSCNDRPEWHSLRIRPAAARSCAPRAWRCATADSPATRTPPSHPPAPPSRPEGCAAGRADETAASRPPGQSH
ncbi:hypothetical protein ADL12_40655 [Streptomyces regalis]|uniref:Uncharacterized protein n=1 Tax=Streptomyces regalis TaxID=68262 RepID=A0A101JAB7_9ACTN|nr:hypothetical protein [Streptomyces regalis]KUL23030.1 hypothetical protein ADL12_40655 [Streptomyces regalis]